MKSHLENLNQAAAFINACSNLVTQLDKHQTGGAMFVCCVALTLVGVVAVALTVPLRAALTPPDDRSKAGKRDRRAPRVADNSRNGRPCANNSRQRK